MTSLELQKKLGPKNIKSIEEYFYKVVVLKGLLNLWEETERLAEGWIPSLTLSDQEVSLIHL